MPEAFYRDGDTVITQKKTFILLELLIMVRESDNKQNSHVFGLCAADRSDILPCSDSCVGSTEARGSTLKGSLTS